MRRSTRSLAAPRSGVLEDAPARALPRATTSTSKKEPERTRSRRSPTGSAATSTANASSPTFGDFSTASRVAHPGDSAARLENGDVPGETLEEALNGGG